MPAGPSARALAKLASWARDQDISVTPQHVEQLAIYLDHLLFWNRRLALVSQQDPSLIVEKHFADALVAAEHSRGADSIVDLGSGAGFPGLIIAIQCPAARVTLLESRRKKAHFLMDAARAISLENVEVVADRIEAVAHQSGHTTQYEISIARALGSLASLLEYSRDFLRSTGTAIAMKGPSYSTELESAPVELLGFGAPTVHSYSLPDQSPRTLLKFPRP